MFKYPFIYPENNKPPIKLVMIDEVTVPYRFKNVKQIANIGVDNCHLIKYNKYFLITI